MVASVTEAALTSAILAACNRLPRCWFFRNNVGSFRRRGRVITYGLGTGSPDIVGMIEGDFQALWVGIEVKLPGKVQQEEQTEWEERCAEIGGVYILATSVKEAVSQLKEILK